VKIVKIDVATRFHILNLKCTKFDFHRGCVPDAAREERAAGRRGPTSKASGEGRGLAPQT